MHEDRLCYQYEAAKAHPDCVRNYIVYNINYSKYWEVLASYCICLNCHSERVELTITVLQIRKGKRDDFGKVSHISP